MESISNLSLGFKKLIDDLSTSSIFKNNRLNSDRLLNWMLFLLILYGLSLKFQLSLSHQLNSDDVSPGLVWKEVFVHGDYFFQGFYFPAADPHIFSDLIPFHMLPQLLSGYNPIALALSSYFVYIAVIITYSLLIYNVTNNITSSLIFSCLFANIPNFAADNFFLKPEIHMGTIFFIGILLLVYTRNMHRRLNAAFYLLVLALISFSDSIILLWYFIPFFGTHVLLTLLNRPFEIRKMSFPFISGIVVSLVYLVKQHIPTFINSPINLVTNKRLVFEHFLLLFKGICLLFNNELFKFSNRYELNIDIIIVVLIVIGIMYFVYSNLSKIFGMNSVLCLFAFLSITFVSIIYVVTTVTIDMYTTRYLTFSLILSISIFALAYSQNMKLQRVYLVLLFSLVLINAGSNSEFSKGVYEQPNKEQYELIDYLKESNLTLGYGDYWDANKITYLSKEEIVVRSVVFTDAKITPYKWLSFKRWFTKPTINDGNVFILQSDLQNEEIENLVLKNPPKEILKFGDYKIYVWDISELRSMMEGFN